MRLPVYLSGLGVFYGWAWVGLMSPTTQFWNDTQDMFLVRTTWIIALSVSMLVFLYLLVRKRSSFSLADNRLFMTFFALLVTTGLVVSTLGTGATATGTILHLAGFALTAIGTSLMPVLWAELYGHLPANKAAPYTVVSILVAISVYMIVTGIPDIVPRLIIVTPLPALSVIMLFRARKLIPAEWKGSQRGPQSKRNFLPTSTALAVPLTLGLAFGLTLGAVDYFGTSQMGAMNSVLVGSIGALALLIGAGIFARKFDFFQFAFRAVVPLVAAGLILLPSRHSLAAAVILGGFIAFDLIICPTVSTLSIRLDLHPLRLTAYARAASHAGILFGVTLGRVIAGGGIMTESQLIVVSFLTLWILIIALTYSSRAGYFTVSPVRPQAAADGMPEPSSRSLHDIASHYNLSGREEEVLGLLVRGRSLPYVQEELHISLGTAKFHVQNIYKKVDVHSRQELFDFMIQEGLVLDSREPQS